MVVKDKGKVTFTLEEALLAMQPESVQRIAGDLIVYDDDDDGKVVVVGACLIGQAAINLGGSADDLYDQLNNFEFRPSPSDAEKVVGEVIAFQGDIGSSVDDIVTYLRGFLTPEQLSSTLSIWERSYSI